MTKPKRLILKERIAPGFWIDAADNLHISIPEILEHLKLENTAENRELATKVAHETLRESCPTALIIEREKP